MSAFDPSQHPHRRYNPLTEEYVLVSPHRTKRPWLGQSEPTQPNALPEYDAACFLCPGNKRANGDANEHYSTTYVFENDFAAILPPPLPLPAISAHPLLKADPVHGRCDVVVFHPRHDLTLARMGLNDLRAVIDEWKRVYEQRSSEEGISYVQIFENKGSMMGCSNPHPHSQVWSLSEIPSLPAKEISALRKYSLSTVEETGAPSGLDNRPCLLCDYAHFEVNCEQSPRVVTKNEYWLALVPWWAVWPFEIMLLPYIRHIRSLSDLTPEESSSFAEILSQVTVRYDNLFSCSFAYSMGIHQSPISPRVPAALHNAEDCDLAHLHVHMLPPLLRSATVRKFLVGYELIAEPQRDLSPEQAATRLRACSHVHYLDEV